MGEISESVAHGMGGRAEITTTKHYPSIQNNPEVARAVVEAAKTVLAPGAVHDNKEFMMGGEDFAFYLLHGKGAFFHIGMRSDKYTFAPWHNQKFVVDEDALVIGPKVFFEFVRQYGSK